MTKAESSKFKGTGVALVTPFNPDGTLDLKGLKKLVDYQIDNGTDYLVILGTTGESPTINADERKDIVSTIKEANNSRLPLVLGVGGNNSAEVGTKLKKLDLSGIDAILSVSPYYNKPNQNGIVAHYEHLADASPIPLILYNVPGRTGSNMTAETQLQLSAHENIIGTKEASGNFLQCMEILNNRPDGFLVISGDDAFTFPLVTLGMDGVISVMCNATPKLFSDMVKMTLAGETEKAKALHYKLLDLMNLIFADGSPGGIKVLLEKAGICGKMLRLPLHDVSKDIEEKLVRAFEKVM